MLGRNFVNNNNNGRAVSIMLATFMLTLFTLTLLPTGTAWAAKGTSVDANTHSSGQPASGNVNENTADVYAVGFQLVLNTTQGGVTTNLTEVHLSNLGNAVYGTDITTNSVQLYEDDQAAGTLGVYDSGVDTLVGTFSGSGSNYDLTGLSYMGAKSGTFYFLVILDVPSGATNNNTIQFHLKTIPEGPGIAVSGGTLNTIDSGITGGTLTIQAAAPPDTVDITTLATSETTAIDKGATAAMLGFNATLDANSADLSDVKVYIDAASTADQNDISAVSLYVDDGTTGGQYDGSDTLVGAMSWNTDHYERLSAGTTMATSPGVDFIVVVTVDSAAATDNQTIILEFANTSDVSMVSPDNTTFSSGVFTGNQTFTINPDTIDITTLATGETTAIDKGATTAMFAFTATLDAGAGNMDDVLVYFDAASSADQNDISSVSLYEDDGTTGGQYDGSDSLVGAMSWSTDHYQILNNAYAITTGGNDFIVVVTVHSSNATDNQDIVLKFNATSDVTADSPDLLTFSSGVFAGNQTFTINPDTVDITTLATGETAAIDKGATAAMLGFTATLDAGAGNMDDVLVYFDAASSADQNDISSVSLYEDDGTTGGQYDGSDSLVGAMSWSTDHYQILNNAYAITTGGVDFIVVVTVHSTNATDNQDIVLKFNATSDVTADSPDTVTFSSGVFAGNQTFTINPDAIDITTLATSETTSVQKLSSYAMFGFTATLDGGIGQMDDVLVYFNSASTADQNDISGVTLYEDDGTTGGQFDGSDTSVGAMSWSTDHYQVLNTNYAVTTGGTDFIMVVTVGAGAGTGEIFKFEFSNSNDVTAVSPDTVNAISVPMVGNQQFDVSAAPPDEVDITILNTGETTAIDKGSSAAMLGFTATLDANAANLGDVKVYIDAASTADENDISSVSLYVDDGTTGGQYDGSDTSVGAMSWNTDHYEILSAGTAIATSPGTDFIVVATVHSANATDSQTIILEFANTSDVTMASPDNTTFSSGVFTGNQTFTINPDTVDITTLATSETTSIDKGATAAMFAFTATLDAGAGNLDDVLVYFDAASSADQNDISSVTLYEDDGTTGGQYDGSDTSIGAMSWNTDHYERLNNNYAVTTGGTDFIVVVTVHSSNATDNQDIIFEFANTSDVTVVGPDNKTFSSGVFAGNQTFTINPDTIDVTSLNTGETTAIDKGATAAMLGFTATLDAGTGNMDDVKVYFDAASTADQNDISSVSLYEDDGTTGGQYDGSDSLVGAMSWSTDHYQALNTNYAITTGGVDFIVVVTVHSSNATDNQDIVLKFNAASDVSAVSPDTVTFSGGTFAGNQTFTINPDAIDVTAYSTSEATSVSKLSSYAMFGFTATLDGGAGQLDDVLVYFNSAATADENDISGVTLYEDDGTTAGKIDGSDTSVGAMSWSTDHYEILNANYAVTTGGTDLIMVVTVGAGALDNEIFKFEFSNSNDVTAVSPDTVNAISVPMVGNQQFTVSSGPPDRLKVSDGSTGQVGATTTFRDDRNIPILQFSVLTSGGSGGNDSITINEMYLNFYDMGGGNVVDNFISSNMVKLYQDLTPFGTFGANDVYEGVFSCDSTTCTLGNLSESVDDVNSNYYMVTGNTTSTPIYSAFKVGLNNGGGIGVTGPDSLATNNPSGVTSANITQDYDRKMAQGWNLITASQADTGLTYNQAFSDDTAPYVPYMIEWENSGTPSSWNCGSPDCQWSTTVQNNTMVYGEAFFLYAEEDGQVLEASTGSYATGQQSVTLEIGGNIVGNPYNQILALDPADHGSGDPGVYIQQNASTPVSLKQATINEWVEADIFWFNGNTYEAVNADGAIDPYNNMVPWRGYWIRLLKDDATYKVIFLD